mmetsp:Transcript_23724/g.67005  ORF Transcript_23724/g.67005 Transcript_23724/m.67005 type:complete len:186 (+) Transcript_23724:155-712(+)
MISIELSSMISAREASQITSHDVKADNGKILCRMLVTPGRMQPALSQESSVPTRPHETTSSILHSKSMLIDQRCGESRVSYRDISAAADWLLTQSSANGRNCGSIVVVVGQALSTSRKYYWRTASRANMFVARIWHDFFHRFPSIVTSFRQFSVELSEVSNTVPNARHRIGQTTTTRNDTDRHHP